MLTLKTFSMYVCVCVYICMYVSKRSMSSVRLSHSPLYVLTHDLSQNYLSRLAVPCTQRIHLQLPLPQFWDYK